MASLGFLLTVLLVLLSVGQHAAECSLRVPRLGREFTCPSASGVFPTSPDSCSQYYYVCSNWFAYLESCPDGYLFDPVTTKCILKSEASCESTDVLTTRASTTSTTTTTTQAPSTTRSSTPSSATTASIISTSEAITTTATITSTTSGAFVCPGTGFYPYDGYCSNKYWACTDSGQAFLVTCPNNLVFDPDTSNCVEPETIPQCQKH